MSGEKTRLAQNAMLNVLNATPQKAAWLAQLDSMLIPKPEDALNVLTDALAVKVKILATSAKTHSSLKTVNARLADPLVLPALQQILATLARTLNAKPANPMETARIV